MRNPVVTRQLGWVPYVMDFSFEETLRFAAAVAVADEFDDLPQWVKDAADAADHKVGVQTLHAYLGHGDETGHAVPVQRAVPPAVNTVPTEPRGHYRPVS